MVAYSFQARFVDAILAGQKTHTIRRPRVGSARHARAGDPLTLLTGPRFKPQRLGSATCEAQCRVDLEFGSALFGGKVTIYGPPRKYAMEGRADHISVGVVFRGAGPLDFFARADGFESWSDMEAGFRAMHHVETGVPWHGVMICWKDFQPC